MDPEKQAILIRLNSEIQLNIQLHSQLITAQKELEDLKKEKDNAKDV